jgi:hypothetical protein
MNKEFDHGALTAVSILMACFDEPTIAADVLVQMGLDTADCSGLDDYDKEHLRQLKDASGVRLRGLGRKRTL